jgi:hypothetical protein
MELLATMAAKIVVIFALIDLLISAATAITILHFYSSFGVTTTILQSYTQQQAFVGGISPFSIVISQHPLDIS